MNSFRMPMPLRRRVLVAAATAAALALTVSACGSSPAMPPMPAMPSMSGTDATPSGDGLSAAGGGFTITSTATTLPAAAATDYRFTITGPDGTPVTDFAVDQTERLHFYAVRSDLSGFQHIHPAMAADGTWTASLAALTPGTWRLFATFTPASGSGKGADFVLSRTVTVPGTAMDAALPAAASSTTVDGYTVTLNGDLMAGMAHPLTVTVTRGGKPVTDLEPYLDTYAHLTAFHQGDGAFAHLHPTTTATAVHRAHGGPTLAFHAELAKAGNWRLFLQFRAGGTLHTAAVTLHVG